MPITECEIRIVQAKRYYRYASIRDDILHKLRLETPPNVTSHRLPAIPQLQSIIDEMCQQKGASCLRTVTGEGGGREATSGPVDDSAQASDDDEDVRATTIKILLFPTPRNSSVRCLTTAAHFPFHCLFCLSSSSL